MIFLRKENWMRASIPIATVALLCALCTIGADAQGQPEIARLEVVFWPEFDRPDMLVIYRIYLSDTTDLPALVSVPIPTEVGAPHAVAVANNEGDMFITPYTQQEAGGWLIIALEASTTEARVEYYAELDIEGSERDFTFDWPGGLDVGDFRYEFQQPVGSEEPIIKPPPEGEYLGLYGLDYYWSSMGALDADSKARIQISYVREQSGLTVDLLQQVPPRSRPEATGTPDQPTATTTLPTETTEPEATPAPGFPPFCPSAMAGMVLAPGLVLILRRRRRIDAAKIG